MTLKFVSVLMLVPFVACAPPPNAEVPTGTVAKARAAAETDDTLPPITTHKGYKCERAKVTKPDLANHRDCEAGFSATTQAEPGHCAKATKTDFCKTGYKLTYKVIAHYDITVWKDGVATCNHMEEDKGLKEVADCR